MQLRRRRLEPARSRRGARGGGRLLDAAAAVQSAVRPRQCRLGQNPSAARDLVGREAAEARGSRCSISPPSASCRGFVQALRARDALAFKEKLRKIDILLIDDMEFLQGPTIQQEFCHTLNSLIDGGRQVVVAADRAPTQLDKLDMRMRSRLGGGLVAEIGVDGLRAPPQDPVEARARGVRRDTRARHLRHGACLPRRAPDRERARARRRGASACARAISSPTSR